MKTPLLILTALITIPAFPAQVAPASAGDPFIAAIEAMKRSVAPLVCLSINGEQSTVLSRPGSVFFVTTRGDFVTAAHNLAEMQKKECPVPAVTLPTQGWQPRALNEPAAWFPLRISDCASDKALDVAVCRPTADLSKLRPEARIVPVQIEWDIPPDGTQVALTGFPFAVRDPITFRADVAAYRPVWRSERVIDELVLDRRAWPGFSGSPVYGSTGRVIGILISGVLEEETALTFIRPVSAFKEMLADGAKNNVK